MNETDFWEAVNPYFDQHGIITIENLQLALGMPEEIAIEAASRFCEERKLCRLVTRDSWGYGRIDPNEDYPQRSWCGGVIPRKR